MFELTYSMKCVGKFESLKAAVKEIYERVTSEETLTELMLHTIWVETPEGKLLFFNDMVERALSAGWIREGRWVGG